MRAFICIEPPSSVIREMERLQSLIAKRKFTGKLTEPENIHLTLKFLGEIDGKTLINVKEILSKINCRKFQALLRNVGTFTFKGEPRIVWAKIGTRDLSALQEEIGDALSPLFPKEERFMSHLTIARIKYVKDKLSFMDFIKNLPVKPLRFQVEEFCLKSSELTLFGPKYETLEEFKLKD